MRKKRLISISVFLIISVNLVSAGIGFGMTNDLSEVTIGAGVDRACITYYIFNPGDVDIEGYLEVDRESGDNLNKLLGLDKEYELLSQYENESKLLDEEYKVIVEKGESTYDVEVKQAEVEKKITEIEERVIKKTKTSSIKIPAHTRAKDVNGKYQIPIDICFDRPQKRYLLFWTIGDTDYCGVYDGEVVGKYLPIANNGASTGSAVLGSRSAELKVIVKCDVNEKRNILIQAIIIPFILVILVILLILRWKKNKRKIAQQNLTSL